MKCDKCGSGHLIVYRTYSRITEYWNGKANGTKFESANCGSIRCIDCGHEDQIGIDRYI